ncbi:hypothetical protein N7478_011693 [Penicillium angulare]|uniref:uncharacterized protein n=1 Tax=Penicillium angulare TaxID=116970 RepID=UPI00253FAA5F|nr:uncharacterized protein N7478_011693 [Penicillium angulare]KAJ5261098.1 hypothetical protein N7478_011693 [Penicillium angulare]
MKDSLILVDAPRRDVVMLPASGYVVIALKTVNPGLLERESDIEINDSTLNSTFKNWQSYTVDDDLVQHDSGV